MRVESYKKKMMMKDQELFIRQAKSGYTVCFAEGCPLREHCLRWMVGSVMPDSVGTYRCVNLKSDGVATQHCLQYRDSQKVRFAKGMLHTFTDAMPRCVEPAVRMGVIRCANRTYYFEYRNGKRLIPPALQETIRALFRDNGWTEDIAFDSYMEDYNW